MVMHTETDVVQLAKINWINLQIANLRKGYALTRKYYRGEHRTQMNDRLKKFLPKTVEGTEFSDNFCEVVVDALAERLRINGFTSSDDAASKWLWEMWKLDRMDRTQGVVHTETIMQGDGYVLIEWDNDASRPRFHYQTADTILPHYSAERRKDLEWLSKTWNVPLSLGATESVTRMNVFYPERIEKYINNKGKWVQHLDEDDGDEWPIPWITRDGDPLGIPVVHFRNDALSDDFGHSELWNAIPIQDWLNKQVIDTIMVEDTMGFPQRFMVNIDSGKSTIDIVPGSVDEYHTGEEKFEIGQWPVADVKGLLEAIELTVQHLAAVTRTPAHLLKLGGTFPSGEALKSAEAGLVSKVGDRQNDFGEAWETVMGIALRLGQTFGTGTPKADVTIEAVWKDTETRNEKDYIEGIAMKREKLDIPLKTAWSELGYSQEQIETMMASRDEARSADTNVGEAILARFSGGGGPGSVPGADPTAVPGREG